MMEEFKSLHDYTANFISLAKFEINYGGSGGTGSSGV